MQHTSDLLFSRQALILVCFRSPCRRTLRPLWCGRGERVVIPPTVFVSETYCVLLNVSAYGPVRLPFTTTEPTGILQLTAFSAGSVVDIPSNCYGYIERAESSSQ